MLIAEKTSLVFEQLASQFLDDFIKLVLVSVQWNCFILGMHAICFIFRYYHISKLFNIIFTQIMLSSKMKDNPRFINPVSLNETDTNFGKTLFKKPSLTKGSKNVLSRQNLVLCGSGMNRTPYDSEIPDL